MIAPARVARHGSGNLPAEVSSFVGRAEQVQHVRRLLGDARLVTLTGVGGVGKTTLALRVAREVNHVFPDGAWLAALSELPSTAGPELVEQAVATALSAGQPGDSLIEYLRGRRCLLLLDNCEHLVAQAGTVITGLLSSLPGLRVLATSREVLGCVGEHIVIVPPLAVSSEDSSYTSDDEALELLRQRTTAAGYPLMEEDLRVGAELCRRLDGIPLAIELAASRLSSLTVTEVLERLDDRFRLLTGGPRHGRAIHQTLRQVMEWSYQLCCESERLLWERISVFSGGFDLQVVETVCSSREIARDEILDLLESLVRQSIVAVDIRDGRARYRLLDTLREYGRERLAQSGCEDQLRRAHHDYYQRLASDAVADWCSPREMVWLERVRGDLANFRVAMDYALRVADPVQSARLAIHLTKIQVWIFYGWLGEGRAWLDRAIARHTDECDVNRLTAMALAGWISLLQGDSELASDYIRECVRAVGSSPKMPELIFIEGTYQLLVESNPESIQTLEQLLRELEHDQVPAEQSAPIRLFWAIAASFLGSREIALAASAQHLEIATQLGPEWLISWAQWIAGLAQLRHGDRCSALNLTRDSLRQQIAIGDRWGLVWGTYQIAWIMAAELRASRGLADSVDGLGLPVAEMIARLLGGAMRMSEWTGVRLAGLGPFHAETERAESVARQVLGEEGYLRAFEEGSGSETDQNLTYDRILGMALGYSVSEPTAEPSKTTIVDLSTEGLTNREYEIAALIADGMSNPEIAQKLVLSSRTVQTHVGNILRKRGLKNRQEIAVWYVRRNS